MNTPKQRSPYGLIQEDLRNQPWKLLIACMMLNLTNIKQVKQVIYNFFERWPTPDSISESDAKDIAGLIKPLGLYNRRTKSIIKFSKAFKDEWKSVYDLPGVGKYAADSYRIFIEGKIDVEPSDSKLKAYVEWARSL